MSMFKKIILLLILTTFVACNATKSGIVTTKKDSSKSKKELAQLAKKQKSSRSNKSRSSRTDSRNRSAQGEKSNSNTTRTNDVVADYISQFKDIAISNMEVYGIPASIILAQAILESGAGKSDLSSRSNNHFGIKCHSDWAGESVKHDDDSNQECFRKYSDPSESFKDHALFLTSRGRYSDLFNLPKDDYQDWAKGLRAAGYATDPKYPEKLITYIEKYNLDQYDAEVLGKKYVSNKRRQVNSQELAVNDDLSLYEVQKGDTFYSISRKFNLMVDQLKRINNLTENALSIGQKLKIK